MNKEYISKIFEYVPNKLKNNTLIVGGFVRDLLLNIKSSDIDFLVKDTTEKEMIDLGFKKVGSDFPVFLDKYGNQFALCRKEEKKGHGYNGFSFLTKGVSFEEDLSRRDLTINAMGIDCNCNLIDPFNGLKDLKESTLRHVSDAFSEDPVRVLRLGRFSAKYQFTIDESTKDLVLSLRKELRYLTPERVFKELEKVLKLNKPQIFFKELKDLKVLDILFPELYEMDLLPHNPKYHYEGNVFQHSLMTLEKACSLSKDPVVRFAALYHDIGKIATYKGNFKYHGHSDYNIVYNELLKIKERLKLPKKYFNLTLKGAIFHHKFHDINIMTPKKIVKMIFDKNFPKSLKDFEDLLIIVRSDSLGRLFIKKLKNNMEVIISGEDIKYIQFFMDLYLIKNSNIKISKEALDSKNVDYIKQDLHKKRIYLVKEVINKNLVKN
jgi:tRNA nucleotidyltransferase (CCA-adding enzyme)